MTQGHKGDKGDKGNEADIGKPASSRAEHPRPADTQNDSRYSTRQPRNLVASVAARLLKVAHERAEEYQLVLMRYGLERLLYRLGRSPYAIQFVVKEALLFSVWAEQTEQAEHTEARAASNETIAGPTASSVLSVRRPHRATHDLDLLGFGTADIARLEQVFRDLC